MSSTANGELKPRMYPSYGSILHFVSSSWSWDACTSGNQTVNILRNGFHGHFKKSFHHALVLRIENFLMYQFQNPFICSDHLSS